MSSEPSSAPRFALDSSALVAMMEHTPGGSVVGAKLHQSTISAINLAEVLDLSTRQGIDTRVMLESLRTLGLQIEPFVAEDALAVSLMLEGAEQGPLTMANRACLALALRLGIPALTTEAAWVDLPLGVEIQVLR